MKEMYIFDADVAEQPYDRNELFSKTHLGVDGTVAYEEQHPLDGVRGGKDVLEHDRLTGHGQNAEQPGAAEDGRQQDGRLDRRPATEEERKLKKENMPILRAIQC